MAKKVVVYSEKGGVGKTTSCSIIGDILAEIGRKVLLIDLDQKNNLTQHRIKDVSIIAGKTIREVLNRECPPEAAILKGLSTDLIGALPTLSKFEKDQEDNPDQYLALSDSLSSVNSNYDYIIIDVPGVKNLITRNALIAADVLIIPTKLEQFDVSSIEGITIELSKCARSRGGIPLEKIVILPTFFEEQSRINSAFLEAVREKYGRMVTTTVIHKASAVSWANMRSGETLERSSRAYSEYRSAVREIL